jgi:hypothetical protein
MAYPGTVTRSDVYRTKMGKTLRISLAGDGAIRVEILEGDAWVAGPVRMAGLRLSPTTRKLTAREVLALPA